MSKFLKLIIVGIPSTIVWWIGARLFLMGLRGLQWSMPELADALMHKVLDPVIDAAQAPSDPPTATWSPRAEFESGMMGGQRVYLVNGSFTDRAEFIRRLLA